VPAAAPKFVPVSVNVDAKPSIIVPSTAVSVGMDIFTGNQPSDV
jgi:hypothetical protein